MTVVELEQMDIDELRAALMRETNDALELGDEIALAVETGRIADAVLAASRLRLVRSRMRTLRSFIRVEDGQR